MPAITFSSNALNANVGSLQSRGVGATQPESGTTTKSLPVPRQFRS